MVGKIQRRVFVGGTGRSGTGNLLWVLGQHPELYAIVPETHFITDAGGLRDLFDRLTHHYNPDAAFLALKDFLQRMKLILGGDPSTMYYDLRLDKIFGVANFHEALNELWPHLVMEVTPDEHCPPIHGLYYRAFGRFYADPEELLRPMRHFVDRLFSSLALEAGKSGWCEKTPHNILHLDFLTQLFPDAYFIHIKRDPYEVVQSWMAMDWAPRSLDAVLNMLEGIYARWFTIKEKVDLSRYRYWEVRLKDLTADSQHGVDQIFKFLDLPSIPGGDFFTQEIHRRRKNDISPEFKKRVNERLGHFFQPLGYAMED